MKLQPVAVTASTSHSAPYDPSHAVDGNPGTLWSAGAFAPQWIQLDLGQLSNLSKIRLLVDQVPNGHTTHLVYGGPTADNLTLLGTFDGSTSFGQWLELNSTATGIRYVRIQTTDSPSWVGWAEIEVYGVASSSPGQIRWLLADQLGTPRMIFDESGSLANMSRHDYLPFGEELLGSIGLRSGLGYTNSDGGRQKFTLKERDNETGLDYFEARYYASTQGRFTSVDPENAGAALFHPQSWNGYAYSLNNPLRFIDPDGLRWAQIALDGGIGYRWFDDEDKDGNGQTAYGRALGNGYSAVSFDESKAFSYTNGLIAPGETLTTTTLNPDGTVGQSNHTVTLGEWSKMLTIFGIFDVGAKGGQLLDGGDGKTTGVTAKLLSDFVSSIVGKDTNISVDLPNVPGPAPGVGSTKADKLSKKADDLIAGSLKRSPSYRSELAQKTYKEIIDLAKRGGAEGRAAKGMKKLIEQSPRIMEKIKGKG